MRMVSEVLPRARLVAVLVVRLETRHECVQILKFGFCDLISAALHSAWRTLQPSYTVSKRFASTT